jgi:hypothetical protein
MTCHKRINLLFTPTEKGTAVPRSSRSVLAPNMAHRLSASAAAATSPGFMTPSTMPYIQQYIRQTLIHDANPFPFIHRCPYALDTPSSLHSNTRLRKRPTTIILSAFCHAQIAQGASLTDRARPVSRSGLGLTQPAELSPTLRRAPCLAEHYSPSALGESTALGWTKR